MTIPNTAKAQKQVPITRINRIKGHRIFRDFSWPADLHEFGRFNLIYGWNGSGKSTLAGIFQSIEKRTVITDGSVEFTINGNSIVGASLPTTAVLPIVRVFTRDVVSASVFAAGTSLAPIFYFGESNVENEKRLETVKAEHKNAELELVNAQRDRQRRDKELEQFSIDQAKVIKETLTAPGSAYNNYDRRNFRSKCEGLSKVDYSSKRLSKDEKGHLGLQKSAQAKPKIEPISCDIPQLYDLIHDVGALLRKTVVSQVIDSLTTAPRLATWVQEGLALHPRDAENTDCHFCGNAIAPERLQALEAHFNDQYKRVIQALDALKGKIDANIQLTTGLSLPDPAKLYDHLVPSYQESKHEWEGKLADLRDVLLVLASALAAKHDKLFESLDLDSFLAGKNADVDKAAVAQLGRINQIIEQHNQHTYDFQRTVEAARKALEECFVAEAMPRYSNALKAAEAESTRVNTASSNVQRLKQKISELEKTLIEHRTPADELNNELHSFLGRSDITLAVKDTGYTITRMGEPALHLSEGEKTAIAFLYFLKSLQDQSIKLEESVVVIDDPISSLDSNALFSAFGHMKIRTKDALQLFILTHSFSFFSQVKNWFHHMKNQNGKDLAKRPARFFMLSRTQSPGGATSTIITLPKLLEEHESDYHYLFKRIYEAAHHEGELDDAYPLPNLARRLVETFLTFRYPSITGDLIKKIELASFDEGQKVRILRFLNVFSHDKQIGATEHDLSLLGEAKPVLLQVLQLIKTEDERHFEQMLLCLGNSGSDAGAE
jgi:wobble nucleotide-excising tRNase